MMSWRMINQGNGGRRHQEGQQCPSLMAGASVLTTLTKRNLKVINAELGKI